MPDERDREVSEGLDDESIRRRQMTVRRGPGAHMTSEKVKLKDAKGILRRLSAYLADRIWYLLLAIAFAFASNLIMIRGTRVVGLAIDSHVAKGDLSGLATISLTLSGIYLVSFLFSFMQSRMMIQVSQRTTSHIRQDLFEKQSFLPVKYFDTHYSGDLMSRLTNDIDQISMALSMNLMQFFNGIISIVGIVISMLLLSPMLTLIFLILTPIMMIITFFFS